MKKTYKIIILVVFAFMLLIPVSAFAQVRNIDATGCEKITIASVLYRPVNLNIRHEEALHVDPEYQFPPQQQSVNVQTPFAEKNDLGVDVVNNGFLINGTGTYTIKWDIQHAGFKQANDDNPEGKRFMDIFIQSSGNPMITLQDSYLTMDNCKIYELQVSEKPIIPTEQEFIEQAYGILTPYIEGIEDKIQENSDKAQRTSDRLSIIGIAVVVLGIIFILVWRSNSRISKETLEDYNLMRGQLRNREEQDSINAYEWERKSNGILDHMKAIIKDHQVMFNIQVEGKINDLGYMIEDFKRFAKYWNVPITDHNTKPLITDSDPSSKHYIPKDVEHDFDVRPKSSFAYVTKLTNKIPEKAKGFARFKKKLPMFNDDVQENIPQLEKVAKLQEKYRKLQEEYEILKKDPETNAIKMEQIGLAMGELCNRIKEEIKIGY